MAAKQWRTQLSMGERKKIGRCCKQLLDWGQTISNPYIAPLVFKMAQNLDLRCVLVPAPWVLGPKHLSNPE